MAHQEGQQAEVKEALMNAYFIDRIDLAKSKNIGTIMQAFGWNTEKTTELLRSDIGKKKYRAKSVIFSKWV